MASNNKTLEPKKKFEPLNILGIFWLAFGIIVLIATFFVKATPRVPLIRGVVTNIIAGLLLLIAGILSIAKARANQRKKSKV